MIFAVLCEGTFPEGAINFRVITQNIAAATDVIIVVDESENMEGEHRWLPGMIQNLDDQLKRLGIGKSIDKPNLYALVGFGLRLTPGDETFLYPRFFTTYDGKPVFTASEFPAVAARLTAKGDIEDGYLAIWYALNNITWPDGTQALRKNQVGIAQNLIFITDEDRDILQGGENLNRHRMKILLRSNNVVPHFVVDHEFWVGGNLALGIDINRRGFVADGWGGYISGPNARQGLPYRETRRDYTALAVDPQVRGTAWDIDLLREGGATSWSFTRAFIDIITTEMARQVNECQQCRCINDGMTGRFQCQRAANQRTCCASVGGTVSHFRLVIFFRSFLMLF